MRILFSILCLLSATFSASFTHAGEPVILLANIYREGIDPGDYLVSEKLDGIRAIWDGHSLRFRSGNPVPAPAWFTAALPSTPLDGELWAGRAHFERLSGIVRKETPDDAEWRSVKYMIFELPGAPGDFAARAEAIQRTVTQAAVPWLQAIDQFRVTNRAELKQKLEVILKAGGEGLMLHRADAPYLTGRSDVLLKLKPWLDAEARVIAHLPGKGRNTGQLGALLVETPENRRFRIGSGFSDAQRKNPPAVGETVTYRYRSETAGGLPRFPVFLRIRATP